MSGRLLLDTNIVIAFFAQEQDISDRMEAAEAFFIPSIVLGELYFGARKSGKPAQNLKLIDELAAKTKILDCNAETAQQYGQLKATLRRKGRPIPENDIWIAAIAVQHNLTLITRDAHFNQVDDLSITTW
ncbi:MAG: type II toxin-antitoxin system VapC family toxin [Anaerolineae bacterium]|nr:type II toxin-antitoxin system VapC family toxin [Anaerolineae bacterium]